MTQEETTVVLGNEYDESLWASLRDVLRRLGATTPSAWLAEVRATSRGAAMGDTLRHLRICFDDGPSYDFLCAEFTMSE